MTQKLPTLQEIQASAGGLPMLGATVAWRLSGMSVQYSDLVTLLESLNLNAYIPEPPSAINALRRAIVRWVDERKAQGALPQLADELTVTGASSAAMIRRIPASRKQSPYHVFVLAKELFIHASLGIKYGAYARILLNKVTKDLTVMTEAEGLPHAQASQAQDEANHIAREIGPLFTHERGIVPAEDVSRLIRELVGRCDAVSLRSGGGYYFVPASKYVELDQVRHLLETLDPTGEKSFLLVTPVIDIAAVRNDMARAAFVGILEEIRAYEQDMRRILERDVREETLITRLDEYQTMRHRIEALRDQLGMQDAKLFDALTSLEATCRTALTGTGVSASTTTDDGSDDFGDIEIDV